MNAPEQYLVLSEYYRLADLEQFKGQVKAGDVIPVPLFPIGNWKSAKYPALDLTQDLADEIIANFAAHVLGTDPVIDSSGRHDSSAPAAAWTKRLTIEPTKDGGSLLVAWSELTDVGADDLNNGRYRYASVEIGPHVDNVTGDVTDSVYRGATFTNTPVLRIMPAVLDTAAAIAASEQHLAIALTEDPGDHAEPIDGSSDAASQPAKADEGQDVVLADGDAAPKGADQHMKTVIEALNKLGIDGIKLSEGANDGDIEVAVMRLAEHAKGETKRANDATAKLADVEKAKRAGEVEVELTEIEKAGNLKPGEKAQFILEATEKPDVYAARLADRKALKPNTIIDKSVHGSGNEGDGGSTKRADVELYELATLKMAELKCDYAVAANLVLSENKGGVADRYRDLTTAGREG